MCGRRLRVGANVLVVNLRFDFVGIADAEGIAAIWIRARKARGSKSVEEPRSLHEFIVGRMADPTAWFILAREGEEAIGCAHGVAAREGDGDGIVVPGLMHLSAVAVEPAHWRRGIGRALTEKALAIAFEGGYTSVQLWTERTNLSAVALYRSLGFCATGRERIDRDEPIVHFIRSIAHPPSHRPIE
jgi:ribosomal protein S18 acetylase RimI-like enzyme